MRFSLPAWLGVLLATLAAGGAKSHAQPAGSDSLARRTWVRMDLGLGAVAGQAGGVSLSASVGRQQGHALYSIRSATTAQLSGKQWTDVGMLYGRSASWQWPRINASLSAGLAYVVSPPGHHNTVGVPVQVQFYGTKRPGPVSIGLGAFGNFNPERLFGGLTFGVVFGDLR